MELLVYRGAKEGPRLDKFILQQRPGLSPGILHRYLRQNKIKLNGKKQPLATRLRPGDEVCLYLPEGAARRQDSLVVLFESLHLIAVNKPAGLPSMGADEREDDDPAAHTLLAILRRQLVAGGAYTPGPGAFRPVLCHRLDTGTSGVILAAKTAEGEAFGRELLRSHALEKEYLCVTLGHPLPAGGALTSWLTKDARAGRAKVHPVRVPGAKQARLTYETLAVSGPLALLQVRLQTGRTHQIRAQLAALGTPLLGDGKYGDLAANRRHRCKYQCLCAVALRFPAEIESPAFQEMAGREIRCAMPWFYGAVLDGKLGGGA